MAKNNKKNRRKEKEKVRTGESARKRASGTGRRGKIFKTMLITILCVIFVCAVAAICVNAYVKSVGGKRIVSAEQAAAYENTDCIVVLGCGVYADGTPSPMLRDRLERAIELYKAGAAPKIIMSGDHGTEGYDEVNTMKKYAVDAGVPSEDVFMDHAGFSTYETVYRAKEIFCAENVIIVTQEYHLYRALYLAEKLGLKAHGVGADYRTYAGQTVRNVREILARCKDFGSAIFKPKPTFLGEKIPVSGDGNATNDKYSEEYTR